MNPKLLLKDNTFTISVEFVFPPYEAGIRYADGTSETYITSLDEFGDIVITKKYSTLPTLNNEPIFTSDGQLVEVTPENLPVTNVSVDGSVWSLTGELPAISFINLDGFVLDFEAFRNNRNDITEDTPYVINYEGHPFQDFLLIEVVGDDGVTSYEPISLTKIILK